MTGSSLRIALVVALSASALIAKTAPEKPAAPPLFAQQESDLKPDPAAHFGSLANGLRYVVLPNHEPRDRASLRLLVLAGSLNEKEDQRGLAHFLEHMAFNGSTHYPPGTLVEFFQRMGMGFGADVNAHTGFDQTVYLLELPHADTATVAEGMRVFSDYAGGLLLRDEEIEKERGIILSEKRARDSVGYRSFVAQFEATLGTTLLPRRLVIGLPEVIAAAHRDRFVDFWNAWYRPEKMIVVAVGDFADAAAIEKLVRENFDALHAREAVRPDPSLGKLATFDGVRPVFHAEPEAPATDVAIRSLTPHGHDLDTAEFRKARLRRTLAEAMLNRRFSILSKREKAPFTFASVNVSEQFKFFRDAGVHVVCKPETWQPALAVGEQELRRALEHGFMPGELAEAKANLSNQLEQAAKTASTRHSDHLADSIVENLVAEHVFTTPADDLALLKPALTAITVDDCLAALRNDFAGPGRFVTVTGNVKIDGNAADAITAAYNSAHAVAVTAPDTGKQLAWGYTDFGPPGTITKREHVDDLGIELITFRNGARLNLKKTDFQAGHVNLSAAIGNGKITEPPNQEGVGNLAANTFIAGGLGKHSADDLQQLLAGKNVGWRFSPSLDAIELTGESTPDDLELDLQLLAAEITDPGYRPEARRVADKMIEQIYGFLKHTVQGPISIELPPILHNGDVRFGEPPQQVLMSRTMDEVKAWLRPQLAHGALEVALVGDFDIEAAIGAAARTIGALPAREEKPRLDELKRVSYPADPFNKSYDFESEIPKGAVVVYWPTDDRLDVKRGRRFTMLAEILRDRLRVKVREEIGGTYSPQAMSAASDVFPHYGYMFANVDVDPANAAKISDLVVNIADDLKQKGVTEDEFKRAREPILASIKTSVRDNSYWLPGVVARAQEKPQWLEAARTRVADFESITAPEISALAAKYFGRDQASRATILPTPPAAGAAPTATPTK